MPRSRKPRSHKRRSDQRRGDDFTSSESSVPSSPDHRPSKRSKKSSDPAFDDDDDEYIPSIPPMPPQIVGDRQSSNEGRATMTNRRDPFDMLDDGIVHMIISQLSACETEVLRRVSKLWKVSSESHCGRSALLQHFPDAGVNLAGPGSVEEENLRFRRYLYHRESLRRGLATRAFRCTGVTTWHLKQHTLLWAHRCGNASIRHLRNADASVSPDAVEEAIRLPRLNNLDYVECLRLLDDGDMIVIMKMKGGLIPLPPQRKTIRVSKTGLVSWEINTAGWWSFPAVGKTGIFFVREIDLGGVWPTYSLTRPKLIKYSPQDGSPSSHFPPPSADEQFWHATQADDALMLTSHEKFVVYAFKASLVSVISTDNGEVVFAFRRDEEAYMLPSILDDSFWLICPDLWNAPPGAHLNHQPGHNIRRFSCLISQESSSRFQIKPIEFPWLQHRHSKQWFFDANSASLFRINPTSLPRLMNPPPRPFLFPPPIPQPAGGPEQSLTDPFTNVTILTADRPPTILPDCVTLEGHDSPSIITLPGASRGRRPLEIETQFNWVEDHWRLRRGEGRGEYLEMMEKYLIHFSPHDELLHLVDFWPSW